MSKAITVKQVGWRLGGEAQVTLWVASIDRASVDIFEEYERSVLVYRTTLQILDPDPALVCRGI